MAAYTFRTWPNEPSQYTREGRRKAALMVLLASKFLSSRKIIYISLQPLHVL